MNNPLEKGEYHLGLYKITVTSDMNIFWEKFDGFDRINKGLCVIKYGFLLIKSNLSSNNSMQSRREWFHTLRSLPKWDITPIWGLLESLKTCNQKKRKFESILTSIEHLKIHSEKPISMSRISSIKSKRFFSLLSDMLEPITQLRKHFFEKNLGVRVHPRLKYFFKSMRVLCYFILRKFLMIL